MKTDWQTKVVAYLAEILGLEATFHVRDDRESFPALLEQAYEVGELGIQGQPYLALHAESEVPSMETMAKHGAWFTDRTKRRVIFVFDRINAYDRKRLIEHRLPFVVPGNQLYLPDMGIELREHFRAPARTQRALTPAAQVVVLAAVLGRRWINDEMTGAGLAEQIGYTKMTMTRALDELRQHGWIETEGTRRFARNRFVLTRRELWERARPYLRTPVIKRVYLDEWGSGMEYLAGEAALAKRTMLTGDDRPTWAMTKKQLDGFLRRNPAYEVPEESKRAATMQIEVWRYDPALLAEPPYVDPLSLALSLKEVQDERVQLAVDQLIEGIPW